MPNQCISYESAVASLREIAKNPNSRFLYIPGDSFLDGDHNLTQRAQMTLKFLEENPQTAKVVREVLSNSSCGDIAQLIQGIPAGLRDSLLVNQLSGTSLEKSSQELRTGMQYASDSFTKGVDKAYKGVMDASVILGIVTLVAAGVYVTSRMIRR